MFHPFPRAIAAAVVFMQKNDMEGGAYSSSVDESWIQKY